MLTGGMVAKLGLTGIAFGKIVQVNLRVFTTTH